MKNLKSLLTFLMLLTCMHSVAEKKDVAVSRIPRCTTGQVVWRTPIALADVLYVVYDDTASELELSCDSPDIAYTFIIYDKDGAELLSGDKVFNADGESVIDISTLGTGEFTIEFTIGYNLYVGELNVE
ncbi:MAG: hypothetical protein IJY03_11060 [Prevotella sp.]|nr:hypothetical protein [Prevotella sp.]MBQ9094500.1 hypothetical protein [Prevotella sp.]